MYVHRSNRLEVLVGVLAELVSVPPRDPFARECIVVQGRGMERWLSMELAQRLGIWANADFPFPRTIIDRMLDAGLDETEPVASVFDPETLVWTIAELLPACSSQPEFADVRAYLESGASARRRFQLAARIADTFDHYAVYRPDLVLGWEKNEGADWQAVLWRAVVARHGSRHVAARTLALRGALQGNADLSGKLPARISLFGVSALPPLYVDVLAAVSAVVELHLFLLSPSREYWGDIRSRREKIRELGRRGANVEEAVEALHLRDAPPLLESLGRAGRDFQQVLEGAVDYQDDPRDLYVDPGTGSMLSALQSDLLALRSRPDDSGEAGSPALVEGDDSISVHVCHGPMREVEVLHDQLVAAFTRDPSLQPQDAVVMTPEIETYAPVIEAVFASDHRPRIPFRISDRSPYASQEVMEALAAVLDVLGGRFQASAVLDLLALAAVRERFGIVAEELDRVRRWVASAGVRWGIDASHRSAMGQPEDPEHTWRFGLDRLLLGYALPMRGQALYRGVLPYDGVEGAEGELLGRVAECCAQLFESGSRLDGPRPLARWGEDLASVLSQMVAVTTRNAHQHEEVRRALATLAERAERAGFTGPVDLETVRVHLGRELEAARSPHGFLTGGVTFCELVPMRSIPFRVVCLLGLNADTFPRSPRPPGFDLVAQRPRVGDRNPRDEDRYLFLEALLSARERLIITYTGQSISDNTERPPSVVLSELLDAIDCTYAEAEPTGERGAVGHQYSLPFAAGPRPLVDAIAPRAHGRTGARAHGSRPSDRLVVRHRLQPFSPRYFDGSTPSLFSYARRECEAARALVAERHAPPPFVSAPLSPGEPVEAVTLEELIAFFERPIRRFVQRRLGLMLGERDDGVDDREPIVLDPLAEWRLGDQLLRRALRGEPPDDDFSLARAGGHLPPGQLGRAAYDAVAPGAQAIVAATFRARGGARATPVEIDLTIDGIRLTGILRDVWPLGQVVAQFSRLGKRHELGHWIRHLALNASCGAVRSVVIGRGATRKDASASMRTGWRPVGEARGTLAGLLDLYRIGQTYPLPLFERMSRAYVERLRRGERAEEALKAVSTLWTSYIGFGDGTDPHVALVYGEQPPLDIDPPPGTPSFAEVARRVYDPFFDHVEEPVE